MCPLTFSRCAERALLRKHSAGRLPRREPTRREQTSCEESLLSIADCGSAFESLVVCSTPNMSRNAVERCRARIWSMIIRAAFTAALLIAASGACPPAYTEVGNCKEAKMLPKLLNHVKHGSCVRASHCNKPRPRCIADVPTTPFVCDIPENICGNNEQAFNDYILPLSAQAFRDWSSCYHYVIVENPTNCPIDSQFISCLNEQRNVLCTAEDKYSNDFNTCFEDAFRRLAAPCKG
jgi:hypothetical protein